MYTSLSLDFEGTNNYLCNNEKKLDNLAQINIFIGPNNSGKSRFMRALFLNENPRFNVKEYDLNKINSIINTLKKEVESLARYSSSTSQKITLSDINFLSFDSDLNSIYTSLENRIGDNLFYFTSDNERTLSLQIKEIVKKYLPDLVHLKNHESLKKYSRTNIYIPTLRGLRGNDYIQSANTINGKDTYAKRTVNDYFPKVKNIETKIYTGLNIYNDIKSHLLNHAEQRKKVRKFETFLQDTFFDGKEVTIIPHIEDDSIHIKIGDDDDFPIYKLGEGVQSIIILTYPLFFNKETNLSVFYEEPDLFLHPSFQRIFLETLAKPEFSNIQFYMTTHSNHFLDMTLDFSSISVYTFKKKSKEEFTIENVKNDDTNILEILGIKNSSVFLSNCTIWVEGITDRIYIRKYLELIQKNEKKKFLEDIHYSFVEYGGNNITHWSFLESDDENHKNMMVEKLCGKLFLVADQDGAGNKKGGEKSKKLLRQEELKETLGERFYVLESKEIENLLSEDIIIKVIEENEGDNSVNIDFKKLKREKYKNQPLGKFIEENVSGISRKYAKNGTIGAKSPFAKKAVQYMTTLDDLTDEAKDLANKIYEFIKKNNP